MNGNRIWAILKKQLKDTLKNKTVFIQFILLPAMALIMENAIKVEGMQENFFVQLFASMYVGMAPLTSMAAVISEEKEQNTLRSLRLANVKAGEYLVGVGLHIWALCMLGACVFAAVAGLTGADFAAFLGVMCVGIIISILVGAAIGMLCKNQMTATSVSLPVMMVFAFLPMISMFNETVKAAARFTYSQQISLMLGRVGGKIMDKGPETAVILAVNLALILAVFLAAYRKRGLE